MGQAEGSVVHGDHPAGVQVQEGPGCIGRTRMNVAELWRVIRPDRQKCNFRCEPSTDLLKPRKISGIARVIHRMLSRAYDVTAITPMGILDYASAPMT